MTAYHRITSWLHHVNTATSATMFLCLVTLIRCIKNPHTEFHQIAPCKPVFFNKPHAKQAPGDAFRGILYNSWRHSQAKPPPGECDSIGNIIWFSLLSDSPGALGTA